MTASIRRRAAPGYIANAVSLDGAGDCLTLGTGLTGAVDSKLWTASFWIKVIAAPHTQGICSGSFSLVGSATGTRIQAQNTDFKIVFLGREPGSTTVSNASFRTATPWLSSLPTGWLHVMASIDLSDTAKRHLYVNDISDLEVNIYNNANIDFTLACWIIGGSNQDGTFSSQIDIADFLMWPGVYIDLSVQDNRRKFISAVGKPVDPAVSIAALGAPIIAQYGLTDDWHTNKGSGSGFTENGALSDAIPGPNADI